MLRLLCAGAFAGLLLAAPLQAQSAGTRFGITPYAGYMKFGNLVNGPLGTSVRGAAGPVYGAEAVLGLTRGVALVGNLAYAKSDLEVGLPIAGGISFGSSNALMYDAALRLSLPLGGSGITPFVQGGAGAMRQELEVASISTTATNVAYNVGAGLDVPMGPRLGLQLMAKDYIGKFDTRDVVAFDLNNETTHNWTVSAGVRFGL